MPGGGLGRSGTGAIHGICEPRGWWPEGWESFAGLPPRTWIGDDALTSRARVGLRNQEALMTSKADFTDEEWTRLKRAPFVAGMAISLADPGGQQILLDDPAGNPIELFQPAGT